MVNLCILLATGIIATLAIGRFARVDATSNRLRKSKQLNTRSDYLDPPFCSTETEIFPNNRRWVDTWKASKKRHSAITKDHQCPRYDPISDLYQPISFEAFITARNVSHVHRNLHLLAMGGLSYLDRVTIILLYTEDPEITSDGDIDTNDRIDFQFEVNIHFESINDFSHEALSFWEYSMRNKYSKDIKSDYVWYLDDSTSITEDAVSVIYSSCKDRSFRTLYAMSSISTISKYIMHAYERDFIFFHTKSLKLSNFVIPALAARMGIFALQSDGEVWFLTSIQSYIYCIDFIDQIIYSSSVDWVHIVSDYNLIYKPNLPGEHRKDIDANLPTLPPEDRLSAMHNAKAFCSNNHPDALRQLHICQAESYCIETVYGGFIFEMGLSNEDLRRSPLSKESVASIRDSTLNNHDISVISPFLIAGACFNRSDYDGNSSWQHKTNMYVINLKHRVDRLDAFTAMWNRSNLTRSCIETNNSDQQERKPMFPEVNMFRVEGVNINHIKGLGCTKSHIRALVHFIKSDKEYGMIFEDDFSFLHVDLARQKIDELFSDLDGRFDVFLFSLHYFSTRRNKLEFFDIEDEDEDEQLPLLNGKYKRVKWSTSASGYIVSKSFAHRLLDNYIESAVAMEMGLHWKLEIHDVKWNYLKESSIWLSFEGIFSYQSAGYSDNQDTTRSLDDLEFLDLEETVESIAKRPSLAPEEKINQWTFDELKEASYNGSMKNLDESLDIDRIVIHVHVKDAAASSLFEQLFLICTGISYALNNGVKYEVIVNDQLNSHTQAFATTFLGHLQTTSTGTVTRVDPGELLHFRETIQAVNKRFQSIPSWSTIADERTRTRMQLHGVFQNSLHFADLKEAVFSWLQSSLSMKEKKLVDRLFHYICDNAMDRLKVFVYIRSNVAQGGLEQGDNNRLDYIISDYYYDLAFQTLEAALKLNESNVFYVFFGEDVSYARKLYDNIHMPNSYFMDNLPEHISLALMTKLDSGIISNSFLSWWAAFLQTPSRPPPVGEGSCRQMIISPRLWFKDGIDQSGRLLPNEWIALFNH